MYTGGYVNEFEIIMGSSNGDLGEMRWSTYLFWVLMVLLAIVSIKAQLDDRALRLTVIERKGHTDFNYQARSNTMRDQVLNKGRAAQP